MTQNIMACRTWHIHLGAHKTATTHIQNELAARSEELQAKGVFFFPLNETRDLLTFGDISLPPLLRLKKRLGMKTRQDKAFTSQYFVRACVEQLRGQIEKRAGATHRIVLSEENLLGLTDQVFDNNYFNGNNRLKLIQELAKTTPVHLFLALRTLDEFLPSAYAQALRTIPSNRLDFHNKIAHMIRNPPSWASLVARIGDHIPNAYITVWDYSDYATNAMAIQSIITGCSLEGTTTYIRPERTRSPSAKAIQMAEQIQEGDWRKRLKIVNQIYAEHPTSGSDTAFRPIDDNGCARLRDAYLDDLAKITAMPHVRFKQFEAEQIGG